MYEYYVNALYAKLQISFTQFHLYTSPQKCRAAVKCTDIVLEKDRIDELVGCV